MPKAAEDLLMRSMKAYENLVAEDDLVMCIPLRNSAHSTCRVTGWCICMPAVLYGYTKALSEYHHDLAFCTLSLYLSVLNPPVTFNYTG